MELRSGAVTGQGIMPPAYRPYFEEGARIVFQRWTALNLAVENQWGGPTSAEKAQQIYNECIAWFYASKEHYEDDLEEEFLDVLSQDFNMDCEDGSPKEVASVLIKLFRECAGGSSPTLDRLRVQAAAGPSGAASSRKQTVDRDGTVLDGDDEDSSSDSGDDEMEDAAALSGSAQPRQPPAPPERVVDEDGFELVQKGGRRRR